ncbi:hypothetical protein [Flavihumibacter petaseus]|nr:hypothetical protein [Flavihumibacter petaseus]
MNTIAENTVALSQPDLKSMVSQLFGQEQEARALDKEIKTKKAHYHHLILKNSEKLFSDAEMIAINTVHREWQELKDRQAGLFAKADHIREILKSLVQSLDGGRWIHSTDDFLHPHWEFWLEDDELKFAQLNGKGY